MIGWDIKTNFLFLTKTFIFIISILINSSMANSVPGNESNAKYPSLEDTSIPKYNGPVITEQQAIISSLKNSRKLQSLNTNVQMAEYRFKSSGNLRNPEIRLSDVDASEIGDRINEYELGVRFRFPEPGELGENK